MDVETNELPIAEVKKLRLSHRYHLMGNDCLIESDSIKPFIAKILDVSHAGALVHAKSYFGAVGDVIDVYCRMNLNEENNIFNLKSVIKSVREEDNSDLVMCGIEFIDVTPELGLLLKNYIYKSLTE
ncbi:MAG: PilZ domain-containing protein [Nitrosomonadales bacterium]|jgi:c-di-GMP-binding flagellar brake protein YcgR